MDSFYNDYFSGVHSEANLFTLTAGVNIHELPRTLRNVQNFDYSEGLNHLCGYIRNILPKQSHQEEVTPVIDASNRSISIITDRQVTKEDIRKAVLLDTIQLNVMNGLQLIRISMLWRRISARIA